MVSSAHELYWEGAGPPTPLDQDLVTKCQLSIVASPPQRTHRRWFIEPLDNFLSARRLYIRPPQTHFSSSNPFGRFETEYESVLILCDAEMSKEAFIAVGEAVEKHPRAQIYLPRLPGILEKPAPILTSEVGVEHLLDSVNPLGFCVYVRGAARHHIGWGFGRMVDDPTGATYTPPSFSITVSSTVVKHTVEHWRGANRSRQQCQVMGLSAGDMASHVGINSSSGRGWEWLHFVAHSMGGGSAIDGVPVTGPLDPQVAWNMAVAGTEETNSRMLVMESLLEAELVDGSALEIQLRVHPSWFGHPDHLLSEFLGYEAMLVYPGGMQVYINKWFYPMQVSRPLSIELALQMAIQKACVSAGRIPFIGNGAFITHRSPERRVWFSS